MSIWNIFGHPNGTLAPTPAQLANNPHSQASMSMGQLAGMAQSQFNADMSRYKADCAVDSKAGNTLQLERDWRRKQQELVNIYMDVAKKRAEFIQQNGGNTNAVREGYRRFPVPEYDAATGKWIKTKPLADILGQ